MTTCFHYLAAFMAFVFALSSCTSPSATAPLTVLHSSSDPFSASMPAGQTFAINSSIDNVVTGKSGTLIVCPKGCFKDAKGNIVEGYVTIELTEALSLSDMLLANLTTTSAGSQLVTGGMLFFNATMNGQQLTVNKDIPVHIEVPTAKKLPGMMTYKGSRDSAGNMNWTDPQPIENFLQTVDIKLLHFLPNGFHDAVEKGMPWHMHKSATPELEDSLYFMLSAVDGADVVKGMVNMNLNEAYNNSGKQVVNDKYARSSYYTKDIYTGMADTFTPLRTGIDPARVKVIKSKQYQQTLIATREFERRIPLILSTCDSNILDVYLRNLSRNLYELDSMAAKAILTSTVKGKSKFDRDHLRDEFIEFYNKKEGKVRDADKYAALLEGYFDKQLPLIIAELEAAKEKLVKALAEKNAEADKLAEAYTQVLFKRETYRMERYGFNWTSTGWMNVDNGVMSKAWEPKAIAINVTNGTAYDQVYTYSVFLNMKSIYRFNTDNNVLFKCGNENDNSILMPKLADALLVTVAYKGDNAAWSVRRIITGDSVSYTLSLKPIARKALSDSIARFDRGYLSENSIAVDLGYMKKMYVEKKRQEALTKESEFITRLGYLAWPCAEEMPLGEATYH